MFITDNGTISEREAINLNKCLSFYKTYDKHNMELYSICCLSEENPNINEYLNKTPYRINFKMIDDKRCVWEFKTKEEQEAAYQKLLEAKF